MKIVMVRTNPIDPDVRITKEAETLANAGYDVHILGWDRDKTHSKVERISNYTVHRTKLKAPVGIKIILYLPIWWCIVFSWLLKERWDILHAADLDAFVPALIVAKIKRKPIVYDIFDFYADEVPLPKLLRRIVSGVDRYLMKFAYAIIIVDESRIREIGGVPNDNLVVIYNSPPDFLKKVDIPTQKRNNIFTIFYAGLLDKWRSIDKVIASVKAIRDVKLIIAGEGDQVEKIKKWATENPKKIQFIGKISYAEVLEQSFSVDLLFSLYDPIVPLYKFASSNKLFEAMMFGKPILVSDGTSMVDIVRQYDCGIVVNCRDVGEIRSAIIKLKNNPQLCKQLGENGRKAYERAYNWSIMEKRLLNLYEGLLDKNE